jgi:hypothetical protein
VALNGAVGIETTEFRISIGAHEEGLPSDLNVRSTQLLNYDEKPGASATETAEAVNNGWTIDGDATEVPNVLHWQRRALSPTSHVWWGPDNNGQADDQKTDLPDEQALVSPTFHVGADPLVIAFRHRFSFENGGWDGGVVEISTDNGGHWTDVGTTAYNGSTNGATSSPIGASRPAFVNRMVGWPSFANVSLSLGTTFAGGDVKLRFRVGADESTGAPGWEIDDIGVSGATTNPFTALVPDATTCAVVHHR